ncbi:hypothetical protein Y032_0021g290 [Ancylostoma ceylanicum]|uniref:Uncharacterized protein n=1 Tax=Ancylostoma ceylanicum TaxID=53326 RepID=A0A016UYX1_9BILA|nr:hypothetical protein Y032_0021g290 [Ancylostoma ceylanicum]
MDISRDLSGLDNRAGLTNLSSTCFVAPKATGIVSLILQFALLVVSVLVALFFFYHVGGYEYMNWNENSTILEPITHSRPLDSSALGPSGATLSEPLNSTKAEGKEVAAMEATVSKLEVGTNTSSLLSIEQVPNTTIYLEFVDARLDLLELIRISTLVYVGACILWLISIALLLLSIKFEVLDMVTINAIFLTIAVMYAFVHALFIAVLLYYQRDLSWRTMAIVIGSVVILVCTTILGGVALALVIGWYKYIVYMNDNEKCFCLHSIVSLIKRRKRTPQQAAQEYAMPNATRHNDLPYGEEPAVNNFTAF